MKNYEGFLFSRLFRIQSKSEGPEYFLQQLIQEVDIPIKKDAELHEEDKILQEFLGKKVIVSGEFVEDKIVYSGIVKKEN